MDVEVCYAEAERVWRLFVQLSPGATVGDAMAQSEVAALLMRIPADPGIAVFGRRATASTVLADHDRVELLRPLVVDPKEARRRRAAKKRAGGGGQPVTCSTA